MIDTEKEFREGLYSAYSKIRYTTYNVNENFSIQKYIEESCQFLLNNEKYKTEIINKIKNEIVTSNQNIINTIFYDNTFDRNDIDLISVISKYLCILFRNYLNKIIIQIERDGSLCLIDNNNDYYNEEAKENIFRRNLDLININDIKYDDHIQANEVKITFKLNIPSTLSAFENLSVYIDSIKDDYLKNQAQLIDSEINDDSLNNYNNIKSDLINNVIKVYQTQNLYMLIRENDIFNTQNFQNLIYKDYFNIYISKNNNLNFAKEGEVNVLMKIMELYNKGKKYENEEKLCDIILYFESYRKVFQTFIELLRKGEIYFNNICEQMIEQLPNIKFEPFYITQYTTIVNMVIYKTFECIIKCILENIVNFQKDDDGQIFYSMIEYLNDCSNRIMQLNFEYTLYLRELYSLLCFLKVHDSLLKNGNLKENIIKEYFSILNQECRNLYEGNVNEGNNLLKREFEYLRGKVKPEHFPDLMINIFSYRIKQFKLVEYREKMLELIINNRDLIKISQKLLFMFLQRYDLIPLNENNEITREDCIDAFLSISKEDQQQQHKILQLLNNSNDEILDEILLFVFEIKINAYFESKKNSINNQLSDLSFEYFKLSVNFIEENNFQINNNNKLGFLYSIAYIKSYGLILSEAIFKEDKNQQVNFTPINEFLGNKKNNFRNVLKIYLLKCLNILYLPSYDRLQGFNFAVRQIDWINEFNLDDSKRSKLDYLFLNIENRENYEKMIKQFANDNNMNFGETNQMTQLINLIGVDIFYDISINEIISNTCDENYQTQSIIYQKYSTYFQSIYQKGINNLTQISKNLLDLYFSLEIFNQKMGFLKGKPINEYEILLYSHKISFICSQASENSFYKKLLSNDIINTVNQNFIPGGEPNDNIRITTFKFLEEYLNERNNSSYAAYICSCGFWYSVFPCGLPTAENPCPNCKKIIGGISHRLHPRAGHIRVYLNEDQRREVSRRSYYKPFESKLLPEYKNEVNNLQNQVSKGIKRVNLTFFQSKEKIVRELSYISYRLLNFVFYSCVFYSKMLGFFNQENEKIFLLKDIEKDLIWMISENWNELKTELINRNVREIQIFFNLIFPKLSQKLKNAGNFNTNDQRIVFERSINTLIEETINNYQNLSNVYKEFNNKITQNDENSLKSIIQQLIDPRKLDQKNYPTIKYLTVPKYPTEEDFWNKLEHIEHNQVSILKQYRLKSEEIARLQNILLMNPFENYALLKYSNKITRIESKRILIKNELAQMRDEIIKKKYENFERGYNSISRYAKKLDCKELKEEKKISTEDPIAFVLNDNGELGYGMYIAAAYAQFIEYQNSFLKAVLTNINLSELRYFKEQIEKEISCQKATNLEVVSFDIHSDIFMSFYELISCYSFRNCYNNENEIVYEKYKDIEYDFKNINIELGKILLPGKRLFSTEQDFIIYAFEGYAGKNSNVIQIFNENYPQDKIDINVKIDLRNDLAAYADYKEILFNLQILIFHYHKKKSNINRNSLISEAIDNLPKIIQIPENTKEFIKRRDIKIKELIDLYEFIEYLAYRIILENVSDIYKKKLNDKQKKDLNKYFEKKRQITKSQLATTIRKYISRYLSGTKQTDYQNEDENIFEIIRYKEELWEENIFHNDKDKNIDMNEEVIENDNFDDMIEKMNKSFRINVSNSTDFYEVLGGDNLEFGQGVEQLNPINFDNTGNNYENAQRGNKKNRRRMHY